MQQSQKSAQNCSHLNSRDYKDQSRGPAQLALLRENGYELLTVTSGSEGLRLLKSRPIDAIVLEYHLDLMDGAVVAAQIKKVKPQLPIVMLADALVIKADGAHFLWATVHFVLNVKPTQRKEGTLKAQKAPQLRRAGRSREDGEEQKADAAQSTACLKDISFPPRIWRGLRNGRSTL